MCIELPLRNLSLVQITRDEVLLYVRQCSQQTPYNKHNVDSYCDTDDEPQEQDQASSDRQGQLTGNWQLQQQRFEAFSDSNIQNPAEVMHLSEEARFELMVTRDVAARIIQTHWRKWHSWRTKVGCLIVPCLIVTRPLTCLLQTAQAAARGGWSAGPATAAQLSWQSECSDWRAHERHSED